MSPHPDAYNSSSRGFTLIEALVALTILTVGLIPAFQQASQALTLSNSIRNSLIAGHLAQEGVEVVRALRDGNWFATQPYDTGLASCAGGCLVQYNSTSTQPLAGNPPLKIDPDNGLYQYATGDASPYHRAITITAVSPHELKVESTVTWKERADDKSYTIEYHLYDWLQ